MGQRRCSDCYEYGHNKRTCPRNKASHAKVVKAMKEEGLPLFDEWGFGNFHHLTRDMREKHDIGAYEIYRALEMQERKQKATNKPRKCSYCNKPGHNKRTCPDHSADKAAMRALTAKAHKLLASRMRRLGLLPGAMVKARHRKWEEFSMGMITTVEFNDLELGTDKWDTQSENQSWSNIMSRAVNIKAKLHGSNYDFSHTLYSWVKCDAEKEEQYCSVRTISRVSNPNWIPNHPGYRGNEDGEGYYNLSKLYVRKEDAEDAELMAEFQAEIPEIEVETTSW